MMILAVFENQDIGIFINFILVIVPDHSDNYSNYWDIGVKSKLLDILISKKIIKEDMI